MTVADFLRQLEDKNTLSSIMNNPAAQFQIYNKQYWGHTIFPTRNVPENKVKEARIKWRGIVATDSTRFSPVTLRDAARVGSAEFDLGEKDAGAQLFGADLEAVRRSLAGGNLSGSPDASSLLTRFAIIHALQPLVEKEEKEILELMTDGKIYRRGDNAYAQDVQQPNPLGHRITVEDPLSTPDVDPLAPVLHMLDMMASKGLPVRQIKTSRRLVAMLIKHPIVRRTVGGSNTVSSTDGTFTLTNESHAVTLAAVNAYLEANGYAPNLISTYDEVYETLSGPKRFLRENAMVFVSTDAISEDTIRLVRGQSPVILETSVGYYAIGVGENQSAPGRVIITDSFDRDRNARIEVKSWETSGPINTQPEGLACLTWSLKKDAPAKG